jgi:hypothetical protein
VKEAHVSRLKETEDDLIERMAASDLKVRSLYYNGILILSSDRRAKHRDHQTEVKTKETRTRLSLC